VPDAIAVNTFVYLPAGQHSRPLKRPHRAYANICSDQNRSTDLGPQTSCSGQVRISPSAGTISQNR
jgi:hypothetical protein